MAEPDSTLSTQQYDEVANGHRIETWTAQQEAFGGVRDLCEEVAIQCREELAQLRQSWSGESAEVFADGFEQLLTALDGLGDAAASNRDGMREITAVVRELSTESRLLRDEDADWESNLEGDDADTIHRAREGVRGELRDKVEEAAAECERLASSYLLPPPEVTLPGMSLERASDRSAKSAGGPELQGATASTPEAPAAAASPAGHAASGAPAGMMPMTGGGASGNSTSGRKRAAAGEQKPQPPRRRMRPEVSRQERHNKQRHGEFHPYAARQPRRVAGGDDSSFAPNEATIIPPVVSGGSPVLGPHDSGPVLTSDAAQFREPDGEEPRPRRDERGYADGTRAKVEASTSDAAERLSRGQPRGAEAASGAGAGASASKQWRGEAGNSPATDTDTATPDGDESLAQQQQKRREARAERRRERRQEAEEN